MRLIIKFQVDYFTWFIANCLIGKLKIYTCHWHAHMECIERMMWCKTDNETFEGIYGW
jgi:hypothetical protein